MGHAAQAPAQRLKPAAQDSPHDVPSQVAAPFGVPGQGVQDEGPQVAGLVLPTHRPAQRWWPAAHAVATHWLPEQVKAVALSVGHAAQVSPQRRYPLLQLRLQLVPLHAAAPFGELGQGVQRVPQLASDVSARHEPEQR